MKLYSHEEMLDRVIGERGTARRESMESELQSYLADKATERDSSKGENNAQH